VGVWEKIPPQKEFQGKSVVFFDIFFHLARYCDTQAVTHVFSYIIVMIVSSIQLFLLIVDEFIYVYYVDNVDMIVFLSGCNSFLCFPTYK